jgi:hypothetical protein
MSKNWDDLTRLIYDPCAKMVHDKQSADPGNYIVATPGYRWCESQEQYSKLQHEPVHYQKVYRNGCEVNTESKLQFSTLTNPKVKHQQFTRAYLGSYMGAGQGTSHNKDIESELIYGLDTRTLRACNVLPQVDRFQCLPEYGNPQRVQHIVAPWIRGGDNTRDYVRRVNYEARLKHARAQGVANKGEKKL